MAWVSWGRSEERGGEELETWVAGSRTVEGNCGGGWGSPRAVMLGGGGEEEVCNIDMKCCICSIAILSHHGDWPTSTPRVYRLNSPPSRLAVCTSGSILQRLGLDDRGSNSAKSNKKPLGAAALWRLRYHVLSKGYSPVTVTCYGTGQWQWRCVMV